MAKRKIYCPECAGEIYNYDGFSTTEVMLKCKHCRKYLKFNPAWNTVKVIEKPEIKTSSGARFW